MTIFEKMPRVLEMLYSPRLRGWFALLEDETVLPVTEGHAYTLCKQLAVLGAAAILAVDHLPKGYPASMEKMQADFKPGRLHPFLHDLRKSL